MPYCTQADLVAAYGEEDLIKRQPLRDMEADAPDTAAVESAIDAATTEIDSYVLQRYRLPLGADAAARLKRRCVDIAMYYLAGTPSGQDDEKRKRYDDAVEWLRKLAMGKVLLQSRPEATFRSEERRHFYPNDRGFVDPYRRPGRIGRFA